MTGAALFDGEQLPPLFLGRIIEIDPAGDTVVIRF
jgi:hypothetical protein